MKTQITRQTVEIVKQVKLTSNQRLTLVQMSNDGGRARHIDHNVKLDMTALGLIEERDMHTPAEKRAIKEEIVTMWKQMRLLLTAKDAEGLDRMAGNIQGKHRDLTRKAYWLTDAAQEYLVKGKVTITR